MQRVYIMYTSFSHLYFLLHTVSSNSEFIVVADCDHALQLVLNLSEDVDSSVTSVAEVSETGAET